MSATNKEKTQFLIVRARHWSHVFNNAMVRQNHLLAAGICGGIDPEKEADAAIAAFDARFKLESILPAPAEKCSEERCSLPKNHPGLHLLK